MYLSARRFHKKNITLSNASLQLLNSEDDQLEEFITLLNGNEVVVLDGYSFTEEHHKKICARGSKLVCIDDYHSLFYNVNAVINHSPGLSASDFKLSDSTKLYLDLDYALLRKSFYSISECERKNEEISKVFICFGGGDHKHIIDKVITTCTKISCFKELHIVIPDKNYVFESSLPVFYHYNLNAKEMASLMFQCQISICPASTICIESYFAKMCLITGTTADNQTSIHTGITKYSNAVSVGKWNEVRIEELEKVIINSINNWNKLNTLESLNYKYSNAKLREVFTNL